MIDSQLRNSFRATLLAFAILVSLSPVPAQSTPAVTKPDEFLQQRLALLSDLQGLTARAKQLEKQLARAMAEAEIADAAWSLDRDLAKDLLRDAYKLTFPEEAEQERLRKVPVGAMPQMPTPLASTRSALRRAVLKIASRDKEFANELARSAAENLGPYDAHMSYASLARNAVLDGDYDAAGKYILQSIDAEPTQVTGPLEINQLAGKNRAAADEVILAYLNKLALTPLDFQNQSRMRAFFSLSSLIQPNEFLDGISIPPPGPAVMRAYVLYMLNTAAILAEAPSTAHSAHAVLLIVYPLLQQYAPELKPQFLELEQRSRKPGENFSLPTARKTDAEYKAKFDKQVEMELESEHPDATLIQRVISRGDFARARKLIDKLADGPQKTELIEILTAQQAISLANKDDLAGALKLAESLARAASITRVFPVIVGKCAAKDDGLCARDAVNQAVRQLRKADVTPFAPPAGVPASFMGTSKDFDLALTSLANLTSAVMPLKDDLALDLLDELVIAANHTTLDTSQGRTGFETFLFKKLAEKNEERTIAAAIQFQDPLRQIVALAAIDQWKVDKLIKAESATRNKESPVRKKD
jgi:hypothetical protein